MYLTLTKPRKESYSRLRNIEHFQNPLQRYCFFLIYANFWGGFCQKRSKMGQKCAHGCARIDAIERRGPRIESLEMYKGGKNALYIACTEHHRERTLHGAHTRIETERAGRHLPRPYGRRVIGLRMTRVCRTRGSNNVLSRR